MNKARFNKWVDIASAIVFIPLLLTNIALTLATRGQQSGQIIVFGVEKTTWAAWHLALGWLFVVLVLIHLVLHFGCIKAWFLNKSKKC